MAFNNIPHTCVSKQTELNKTVNRVYVNPNFSKAYPINNQYVIKDSNSVVHINRNFPHNIQNKKIYINPNFIPNATQEHSSTQMKSDASQSKEKTLQENMNNIQGNVMYPINCTLLQSEAKAQITVQPTTVKSRYCLVRNTGNKPTDTRPDRTETIKLNKYKSVRLKDIKKSLNNVKQIDKQINKLTKIYSQKYVQKYNNLLPTVHQTQFKYIKCNTQPLTTITIKSAPSNYIINRKSKSDIERKVKYTKGKLKKNNIPCPLFKKYGKCLRNARGNCQYLHDKKHVSICRKFLKGMCHDKTCLLSHELTAKKMPTCNFYLKGMCNKDECPYLHVKLNEKTKICADFMKGYCEKGEKCLNRHVNIRNITSKQESIKKRLTKVKSVKCLRVKDSNDKTNIKCTPETNKSECEAATKPGMQESKIDCRYYKETAVNPTINESYEMIKPTRCKLGKLPSFIKL